MQLNAILMHNIKSIRKSMSPHHYRQFCSKLKCNNQIDFEIKHQFDSVAMFFFGFKQFSSKTAIEHEF